MIAFLLYHYKKKVKENFAFTASINSNSQPAKRYQWKVVPQEM